MLLSKEQKLSKLLQLTPCKYKQVIYTIKTFFFKLLVELQ